MKTVLAILSTDWHLNENNVLEIKDVILQKLKLWRDISSEQPIPPRFICLGDIFDSRKAQKETTLLAFLDLLDTFQQNGIKLECIPGNHDKTNYSSWTSYLDPFREHRALKLYAYPTYDPSTHPFMFMPFIVEEKWIQDIESNILNENIDTKKVILLSHMAVDGSVNNDSSKIRSIINYDLLKNFNQVFLGHYHNHQQVYKNTFHIPSIRQMNFGEDNEKGFTLIYDDFSTKFIKSNFIEYETLSLDINKIDSRTLKDLEEEVVSSQGQVKVRVNFVGDTSKLKAIDTSKLKAIGVKLKYQDTSVPNQTIESCEVQDFESDGAMIQIFEEFCYEKSYSIDEGLDYLKEILNER